VVVGQRYDGLCQSWLGPGTRPKFLEGIWNPETKGIQPEFFDNRLRKNELRSIAESVARLNSATGAILSDFRVRFTLKMVRVADDMWQAQPRLEPFLEPFGLFRGKAAQKVVFARHHKAAD
jgi:hypothetical protein